MTNQSLAARVTALEEKVGSKTIEERLREEAELVTRLFLAWDNKWDVRFGRLDRDVSALRVDLSALQTDVNVLKTDVDVLKTDVHVLKTDVRGLKTDVRGLKRDMIVVRRGVGILLKRRG